MKGSQTLRHTGVLLKGRKLMGKSTASPMSPLQNFTGEFVVNKGNNKITELRTILQRESPNS